MSAPEVALNITNITLGVAVLICVTAVAVSVFQEAASRRRRGLTFADQYGTAHSLESAMPEPPSQTKKERMPELPTWKARITLNMVGHILAALSIYVLVMGCLYFFVARLNPFE